jgi:hypothetical protein
MISRRVLLVVIGGVLAVAVPLAVNRRVHMRADAMSNTAIAHAVLRHGVPPRDPYIAGEPLHYYWAYNAAAAGVSSVLGVEPLAVMVWQGPLALFVLLVSVAALVRRAGGSDGGAALAVFLVLLGLNGWGWTMLATRWLAGDVGVWASLGRGVSPFMRNVVKGYDPRVAFFTAKALLSTSFIWSVALLPVAIGALLRYMRGHGWLHGVVFAFAAGVMAYANLLVGAALMALVAFGLVLWAWLWRGEKGSGTTKRALAGLGLVGVCVGLVLPYLALTVGESASRERLVVLARPDAFHVRGLAVALLPFWVCVGLAGRPRRWGRAQAWLLFLGASFSLAFLVARVVDGGEYKFLFVIAVLLAPYIGSCTVGLARWRVCALWAVVLSAAPTTVLGLVVHARAPGLVVSEAEVATFDWIARNTAPDTIVVTRWRATLVPIFARRDLYVPEVKGFHRGARYDPAEWRRRTEQMERLDRGEIVAVLGAIAEETGRPVVLVTRVPQGMERLRADDPRLGPLRLQARIQHLAASDPRLRRLNASGNLRTWEVTEGRR